MKKPSDPQPNHRLCLRRSGSIQYIAADLVAEVADDEFVAGDQLAFNDSLAVNANAVRAAQIADHEIIMYLRNATVSPRHLFRVQLHVTFLMPTEQQNRLVEHNARAIRQRKKMSRHSGINTVEGDVVYENYTLSVRVRELFHGNS